MTALEASLSEWRFYEETESSNINERIKDAKVVISNKVKLSWSALNAEKIETNLYNGNGNGSGNEYVDLVTARELGIHICNVSSYATSSCSSHVFVLISRQANIE